MSQVKLSDKGILDAKEKLKKIDDLRALVDVDYKTAKSKLEQSKWDVWSAVSKMPKKKIKKENYLSYNKKELLHILDNIVKDASIDDEKKINLIIHATSLICAIVAIQPIPFADVFVLTPIQLIMVTYLNKVIGNPFNESKLSEILTYLLGVVGWGVLAQQLILGMYKTVLPFLGAVTTLPLVYAATYSLGIGAKTVLYAYAKGEHQDKEALKQLIDETKGKVEKDAQFKFTIESLKDELNHVKNQSNEYLLYKKKLTELEHLLQEERQIRIVDDEPADKIAVLFSEQLSFVKDRFKTSYGDYLWISDAVMYSICLLPSEMITLIEYNISQLLQGHTYKLNLQILGDKEMELTIDGIGRFNLYKHKSKYLVNYMVLEDVIQKTYPYIKMSHQNEHKHLKNEEIRMYFEKAILQAKQNLTIVSPWINERVLDSIYPLFDRAVEKGVLIHIVYGYENDRLDDSIHAAQRLKSRYGDSISFKQKNTHYKLVISDNQFYVLGSMNFLSFGGDYSSNNIREEGAIYCSSNEEIESLRQIFTL